MSREIQVRDAIDRFIARMRQQTDAQLEALATELLQVVQGDMRTSRADIERAAVEVARAVAKGGTHARHDLISTVVTAVRRLDDATTLRGVLDVLAEGASAETARTAVLVLDHGTLRPYRHNGFASGQVPSALPADVSQVLSKAVAFRQTTKLAPEADQSSDLPAFMQVPVGHTGLVIPLIVGNQVAALVYAVGADTTDAGAPVWTEQVEVLVRHASARLESVTSQRTVEVLTGSA